MKKIVKLTESDLTRIVKRVIEEQSENYKFTLAVQKFLNDKRILNAKLKVDGLTGRNSQTEKAIMKLQSMLNMYPVDGIWGKETEDALEENKPEWYQIWDDEYRPGWFS